VADLALGVIQALPQSTPFAQRGAQGLATDVAAGADILRLQPQVRVLSPKLRPRPGDLEGRRPHVYAGDEPDDVVLCLLDPDGREW
jgi:hypothetical protein